MPDDFSTYAQARWPSLVAFLVDEGAEREQAEESATAGLARVRPRWREVRQDHDVDEQVLAVVTGRTDRAQADRFLTSLAVQREPDRLPLREPPVAEILERARAARRRTARRWGVAALVVVLVATGGWLVTRQLARPPGVRDAANELPVPWYAGGQLHLADVTVRRPQVVAMVRVVGSAVVTVGRDRAVSLVAPDGRVHRLGTTSAQSVAVDHDRNLVAWNDDSGDTPRLVVYDVSAGRIIDSHPAPDRISAPVTIDQGRVYSQGDVGVQTWLFGSNQASQPAVSTFLDAANGITVSQNQANRLQVVLPAFAGVFSLRGEGADLSLDGRWLVTSRSAGNRTPLAYNASTGAEVTLGVAKGQVALTSAFGPSDSFLFAVRHAANAHEADDTIRLSESGPVLLIECRPSIERSCRTLTQVADDAAYTPVLAQ